jgi:hypothetical protein
MTSLLKSLGALLAAAVLAIPVATAGNRPDDRAVGPRSEASTSTYLVRPDDRSGVRGPANSIVYEVPAASSGGSFDFGDATVGAAIGAGFVLLLSGVALIILRRRVRLAL